MYFSQLIICIIGITFFNISSVQTISCTNLCDNIKCEEILSCEDKQVLKPGGFCNCCNQCITLLNENEICAHPLHRILKGVPPPLVECKESLVCYNGMCKKTDEVLAELNSV